ncbi:unnamed protein product [Trichogramma brassicae]|uniref:Uncharacterized protein n=1 Tax=Trichogramma brassicae TaxID=86971 RepID=A0A6H5IBC0_9HYME|nr:unnamed protein product [Trichogramma brassicae]
MTSATTPAHYGASPYSLPRIQLFFLAVTARRRSFAAARDDFIASAGREKKSSAAAAAAAAAASSSWRVSSILQCAAAERDRQALLLLCVPRVYTTTLATRDSKHTARDPRELRRLHFIISRSLIVFLARFAACAKTIIASRERSSARDNAKCLAATIYYYEPLCTRCTLTPSNNDGDDDDDDDDDDGTHERRSMARHQAWLSHSGARSSSAPAAAAMMISRAVNKSTHAIESFGRDCSAG